jgi:RNA-directed DNA polymerase
MEWFRRLSTLIRDACWRGDAGRVQSPRSSKEVPETGWSEGGQEGGYVMNKKKEERPAVVAETPTQAGEAGILEKWRWTEPSVWTERMLTALERGVKGGKWFSLMDKVYSWGNLESAWEKVKANKGAAGVDEQSLESFQANCERYLGELQRDLRDDLYKAKPVKRVWIPKPGSKEKRPLGIPAVKDRVVQTALRNVLEPIFEKSFAEHSYGFRPGRGCKDALRRVEKLLKTGKTWVVDIDIRKYFDTIPHGLLMKEVGNQVSDGRILDLIKGYLKQGIMEGHQVWEPEVGTPQGAVISPLLGNVYLNPVDHEMTRKGFEMIRYADDTVVLCATQEEAERALKEVRALIEERGLLLHPEKTRIVDASIKGGFDFLGYHFERNTRWPRKKSMDQIKDTIRRKTKRTSGHSLKTVIDDVNQSLRGWFEYFRHSARLTFCILDRWIRVRLRSILRKRNGLKGRGRGFDHLKWPNAYFTKHGLFTLTAAYETACRSRCGNH